MGSISGRESKARALRRVGSVVQRDAVPTPVETQHLAVAPEAKISALRKASNLSASESESSADEEEVPPQGGAGRQNGNSSQLNTCHEQSGLEVVKQMCICFHSRLTSNTLIETKPSLPAGELRTTDTSLNKLSVLVKC
eukprot:g31268.t1